MTKNSAKIRSKSKSRKVGAKGFFIIPKRLNRSTLIIVGFVLVFAGIGAALLLKSQAADYHFNVKDETIQVFNVNKTRVNASLNKLTPIECMDIVARNWSKTMATTTVIDSNGNRVHLRHNPNAATQINNGCGINLHWSAENVAQGPSNCSPLDTTPNICSQSVYQQFMNSAVHKADILAHGTDPIGDRTTPDYVGVGVYRDDNNTIWVTQLFMNCWSCKKAAEPMSYWALSGSATVSSATSARAVNINVHAGTQVSWYHNIKNIGPAPATYPEHVNSYHYSASGALVSSAQVNIGNQTTKWGDVYTWANNATIPATAKIGDRYCHAIYYGYASGPGTGGGISNKACITVH